MRLRVSAIVRRCNALSMASREARSTKSLGVQTLRGAAARMRSSMAVFRSSGALFMSETCIRFSDRLQAECPKYIYKFRTSLVQPGRGFSENPPRPIASPSGRLAQAELGHQVLRGTRRDLQLLRDHAGGGNGPGQHVVEQRRQPGGGAAAVELAGEQGALVKPAIMILEAALGGGRHRFQLDHQPCRRVEWSPPFARDGP